MAEIQATLENLGNGVARVIWEDMSDADTGAPVQVGGYSVMSIQATGTATVVPVQGSNDGTNFAAFPTPITLDGTADAFEEIPVNTLQVKIGAITGGASTTTVTLIAQSLR